MTATTMIILFAIAVFLLAFGFIVYLYIRNKTLEDIRVDVYQLFLKAEKLYLSGEGKQKMEFVIQRARSMLPVWAKFFITEELLERIIQLWFDAVKDLLDDGKYNQSAKDKE